MDLIRSTGSGRLAYGVAGGGFAEPAVYEPDFTLSGGPLDRSQLQFHGGVLGVFESVFNAIGGFFRGLWNFLTGGNQPYQFSPQVPIVPFDGGGYDPYAMSVNPYLGQLMEDRRRQDAMEAEIYRQAELARQQRLQAEREQAAQAASPEPAEQAAAAPPPPAAEPRRQGTLYSPDFMNYLYENYDRFAGRRYHVGRYELNREQLRSAAEAYNQERGRQQGLIDPSQLEPEFDRLRREYDDWGMDRAVSREDVRLAAERLRPAPAVSPSAAPVSEATPPVAVTVPPAEPVPPVADSVPPAESAPVPITEAAPVVSVPPSIGVPAEAIPPAAATVSPEAARPAEPVTSAAEPAPPAGPAPLPACEIYSQAFMRFLSEQYDRFAGNRYYIGRYELNEAQLREAIRIFNEERGAQDGRIDPDGVSAAFERLRREHDDWGFDRAISHADVDTALTRLNQAG